MEDLVVFGVGGFGSEIMEAITTQNNRTNQYKILGFIDDNTEAQNQIINGYKVIGTSQYLLNRNNAINVLVCIGETSIKKLVIDKLRANAQIKYPNFIADGVGFNDEFIHMGIGNIIYYNTVIAVNVTMGNFNYINSSCSISHDVELGDMVTLAPSCTLAGNVRVGNDTYIGMGSVIREGVRVGKVSVVGMGSVVTKDVESNVVAYGNPCEVVRNKCDMERIFR